MMMIMYTRGDTEDLFKAIWAKRSDRSRPKGGHREHVAARDGPAMYHSPTRNPRGRALCRQQRRRRLQSTPVGLIFRRPEALQRRSTRPAVLDTKHTNKRTTGVPIA